MAVEMTEAAVAVPNYALPQSDGDVAIGEVVELWNYEDTVAFENEVYLKTGVTKTPAEYPNALTVQNATYTGSTRFRTGGLNLVCGTEDYIFGLLSGVQVVRLNASDGTNNGGFTLLPPVGTEWVGLAANENHVVLMEENGNVHWRTHSGGFVNQFSFGPTNFDEVYGIALDDSSNMYILCKAKGHTEISIRVISSGFAQMGFIKLRQIQSTLYGITHSENQLYVYGLPTNQVPKVFSLRIDGDWQNPVFRTELYSSSAHFPVFPGGDLHMASNDRLYPVIDVVGTVRSIASNHGNSNNYVRVK